MCSNTDPVHGDTPGNDDESCPGPQPAAETATCTAAVPRLSQSDADHVTIPSTDRDRRGRVVKGNQLSKRTGLYAATVDRLLEQERQAFLTASLADDGGDPDVPTRRRSLHAYRSRLHLHIAQVSGALERFGLFDGRGRLRATWLSKFESLVGTAIRLDTLLGLERRTKDTMTLQQYLDAKAKEAQQTVQASAGDTNGSKADDC